MQRLHSKKRIFKDVLKGGVIYGEHCKEGSIFCDGRTEQAR